MVPFTFSVLGWKYPLTKFGPKIQNYLFKVKFGTWTNSNMPNSMMMSSIFVLDRRYPLWTNLIQKIKIACLS